MPPTLATRKQWTSLVAATYQSVRFTRCHAGQPHLHTCVCPFKLVGGRRACTLVALEALTTMDKVRVLLSITDPYGPAVWGTPDLSPSWCWQLGFPFRLGHCYFWLLVINYIDIKPFFPGVELCAGTVSFLLYDFTNYALYIYNMISSICSLYSQKQFCPSVAASHPSFLIYL